MICDRFIDEISNSEYATVALFYSYIKIEIDVVQVVIFLFRPVLIKFRYFVEN